MKTRNIFIIMALIAASYSPVYAQVFGLRGGFNLSKIHEKAESTPGVITLIEPSKNTIGFHIGPTAEFPISDVFSIETALLFTTKGWKYDYSESIFFMPFSVKSTTTLYYIDLPLTPKFTFDLGGPELFVLAGPYVGIGLYGESKADVTVFGEKQTDKSVIEWNSNGLKRLDYGLTAGTGLRFNQLTFGIYYNYGLANISSYSENGYSVNNRVLNFSMGYLFNQ